MRIGYARASTVRQSLNTQLDFLGARGRHAMPPGGRERHLGSHAASGSWVDGQGGAVGGGDGLHDRQPQAEAPGVAGAVGAEPLERPQEPVNLRWRHDGSAVDHRQDGPSVAGLGCDVDVAVGHVVVQRVVHEVGGQPFGQPRITRRRRRGQRRVHIQAPQLGLRAPGTEHLADYPGEVEGLPGAEARLPAGQGEECFDELFLLGAGGEDPFMGDPEGPGGGVRVGQGDLAEDPLPGQRGAQLV